MKSKRVIGYFCGWENMNCWEVRDRKTGKPTYYSAKRFYRYNMPYFIYIKKNRVFKTKKQYISRNAVRSALAWAEIHMKI